MTKKILYAILIIAVIIILSIIWSGSKNKDFAPEVSNQVNDEAITTTSINEDIDSIEVEAGIDTELNDIEAEINTL